MEQTDEKVGIIYTASSYLLWGFLPIYWKLLQDVPAGEILANRIIWSFLFMLAVILLSRKWRLFVKECKLIVRDKRKLIGISLASVMISLNWLTYIWAVNNDHVIQASLGYYINPLVSILLGIIVLKETLASRELLSFILVGVAVIYLTISYGVFPWIALSLAFSFGFYGLLKKTVKIGAMFGLAIETMIVTPLALIYVPLFTGNTFVQNDILSRTSLLLIGAGIVTAIPLLLFASGAKMIPLSMVGFLQYIAPTIMLILGVFVYDEKFTTAHLIAFSIIWVALIIYMLGKRKAKAPVKLRTNR